MKKVRLLALLTAVITLCVFAACAAPSPDNSATDVPEATENSDATSVPSVTQAPTEAPKDPTQAPTQAPTEAPTEAPTPEPTEVPDTKLLIPYTGKGLVAVYEGNYNTVDGQNKESTTWGDLSGNGNDIVNIALGDKCYWTDEGLYVDTQKILFPAAIPELINSDEYTVEFCIKDLVVTGTNFATFLNSDGNDNFALFIRVGDDSLEFKCNMGIGSRPKMIGGAKEACKTSTIAVTFSAGDVVELYLNGELVSDYNAAENTNMAGNFFIGHPSSEKSYHGIVTGIRFYDRALSEKELAANYAALGTVAVNPDYHE